MENRCWHMAFFHNGQSYWIVPLCTTLRQHSNLKCQPEDSQNIFPNPASWIFHRKRLRNLPWLCLKFRLSVNSMLAMIGLLVFSSSLLQVLSVIRWLLIIALHAVWPLSQGLPSVDALPAARLWASLNGSDLLTVILDVSYLSLHMMPPIYAVMFQRHLRLKTPSPTSPPIFPMEASGAHRNSGCYSQLFSLSEPMWSFCH